MTDETAPASATPLHAIEADLHALLARVESLEHEIKAEIVSHLEAAAARVKAAL